MLTFLDGPAYGVRGLSITRAPLFLRVVRGPTGWDALDQLSDSPTADEVIYVYRKKGSAGRVHTLEQTKNGSRRGTWHVLANYEHYPDAPAEEVLRDSALWSAWAWARYAQENPQLQPE